MNCLRDQGLRDAVCMPQLDTPSTACAWDNEKSKNIISFGMPQIQHPEYLFQEGNWRESWEDKQYIETNLKKKTQYILIKINKSYQICLFERERERVM